MHLLLEPLLRLFASLVSRGGQPHPDRNQYGPVLIYPLRPGLTLLFLGCLAFTAFALAADAPALLHHNLPAVHPVRLPFGLLLGTLALSMLARTLSLDEQGLHLRSLFGRPRLDIPWSDLHHVECYQSHSARKTTWFLRSPTTAPPSPFPR